MTWYDNRLTWNPSVHNISDIHVDQQEVWSPDLLAYNGVGNMDVYSGAGTSMATIHFDGHVSLITSRTLSVFCPMGNGVASFPADSHECAIVFGSASHNILNLDLLPAAYPYQIAPSWKQDNPEWQITGNWTRRDQGQWRNQTWSTMVFKYKLHRVTGDLLGLIRALACGAIFGTLIVFWIPPRLIELRIFVIVATMASDLFLITLIASEVGNWISTGYTGWLIVLLHINVYSLIHSLICYFVSSKCYSTALPVRLASAVNGPFGKVLGLELTGITYDLKTEMNKQDQTGQQLCLVLQEEWILFAVLLDRIMFVFFLSYIWTKYPTI
ncbi:Neuronal acetylcholine receptor subunit alpha-6 [Halotydeus destructor]|nr:Neuronal acetylcholine receptor subunit alpha-6 [Halotydeus destructor]